MGRFLRQPVMTVLVGSLVLVLCSCSRTGASPDQPGAGTGPMVEADGLAPQDSADSAPQASGEQQPPGPGPAQSAPASAPGSAASGSPADAAGGTHQESQGAAVAAGHREELFQDWPTPKLALVVTGQQIGYLEPCGCTGLTNQKGGLSRRHSLIRELSEKGWPLVNVDVGNQVRRFGRQAELKFQITAEALKKMGYDAIALGGDDLRQSVGELAAVTLANEGETSLFVSANAAVLDRSLTPTHHVVEVAGKRIGITSVLGSDLQSKIVGSEILMESPAAGLDAVLPKLKEARCDLLVLLAHTSIAESQELARKYPDFKIVVTAGGVGEPQYQPETIAETGAVLVQVGLKGMFVGVIGFFDDPQTPWRYQRVPLDSRFPDSPEMLDLLASYQQQLKTVGLEGLGVSALPHPTGRGFVGSEKCGECHSIAYELWEKSSHGHATESLIHPPERSEIARHFDPECLSCHVTGWEPQKFFPYQTGYLSLEKTPLLTNTGCENCHGPGSAHVDAESGIGTRELKMQLREAMRLPLASAEKKCLECHDIDNSPGFHVTGAFDKYWKQVEHKGVD